MKAAVRPVERGNEGQLCLLRPNQRAVPRERLTDGEKQWKVTFASVQTHIMNEPRAGLWVLVKPSSLYFTLSLIHFQAGIIPETVRQTPRDAGMMSAVH